MQEAVAGKYGMRHEASNIEWSWGASGQPASSPWELLWVTHPIREGGPYPKDCVGPLLGNSPEPSHSDQLPTVPSQLQDLDRKAARPMPRTHSEPCPLPAALDPPAAVKTSARNSWPRWARVTGASAPSFPAGPRPGQARR